MKRSLLVLFAILLMAIPLAAQSVPDIAFDSKGQIQVLLGRKAESERVPALPLNPQAGAARGGGERGAGERGGGERGAGGRGGGLPGAGAQSDVFQRPSDVAWDSAGNIYVA